MAWNVLILGGGFGGLYAARKLERSLPPHAAKITVVSDVNFMLYTPLLPGAAAGTLEPRHVVVPLREHLHHADLLLAQVTSADPDHKQVFVTTAEGQERTLGYDHVIVALGSISRALPIPGLKEHAVGFKTLSDAIALRNHIVQTLERAESVEDEAARRALLSYVFVGAGYAGLEGLAELQDFAADVVDLYPRSRVQGLRFILVEARDRVMPEISAELAAFATAELRRRGVEVRTSTTVERISADSVELSDGEVVPCRTVAWTAGVRPHPVVEKLGLPLDRTGRIVVDRFCQVEGRTNVWAIGDAAAVPDPARPGQPTPPTCQHALRQGRTVAGNVAAALGAGRPKPFTYKTLGVFVDMGHQKAVAETVGIKWRGFPAWFLARTYHLAMMPGIKRQIRLMVDWTVDLVFGRDTSELGQLGHPPELELPAGAGAGRRDGAPLTAGAVALVLASAGLHAFWNWLVADARDSHAVGAVALLTAAIVFAPVAALTWAVESGAWPYIVASAALELAYFALLAAAYERADLSFVYPIARGTAPVLVLVVSLLALGADLSAGEAAGVLAVAAGVLLVRGVGGGAATTGLVMALGVAGCIAAYTLVDDEGVRHAAALSYFEAVLLITAPLYAVAVALARGPGALRVAATPRSAAAGVAMFGAYALTLAALEIAEAAPVAALRETSVVMATAAAAIAGREHVPPRRLAGAVVVVLGVALIAL